MGLAFGNINSRFNNIYKACSKFGGKFLKETHNTYDTAIAVAFCLAATESENVSFGGGMVATKYRLNQNGSEFLNLIGRPLGYPNVKSLPTILAGILLLKQKGDERWGTNNTYQGQNYICFK